MKARCYGQKFLKLIIVLPRTTASQLQMSLKASFLKIPCLIQYDLFFLISSRSFQIGCFLQEVTVFDMDNRMFLTRKICLCFFFILTRVKKIGVCFMSKRPSNFSKTSKYLCVNREFQFLPLMQSIILLSLFQNQKMRRFCTIYLNSIQIFHGNTSMYLQ